MFLLCKDDVTRKDGTFTVNHPFMITLQNRLYAAVAFPTQELAEYFKKMLKLEGEYKALDIGIIEKSVSSRSLGICMYSPLKRISTDCSVRTGEAKPVQKTWWILPRYGLI